MGERREGAEQHRATNRPPREMAQKMANKRAGGTVARATSPLGALLPGRRAGATVARASSTSKGADTAAYIETLPGISAPFNKGFFDPLGLKPKDDAEFFELQTKELNNGRLAMLGIAGFVAAELKSPGTEVFEHLFQILDYDLVKEVDLVEDIVGLPETPLPELDSTTLSNLGFN